MPGAPIRFRLLTDISELEQYRTEWVRLIETAQPRSPYVSPDWVISWLRAYGRDLSLRIFLAWSGERLVGILPFYLKARFFLGIRYETLAFLQNDYTPEAEFLIDPRALHLVFQSFFREVFDWVPEAELINIEHLSQYSAQYQVFKPVLRQYYPRATEVSEYQAHCLDFRSNWQEFLAGRSRNFRNEIRQAKSLERRHPMSVSVITTASEFEGAFEELRSVSERSWQGQWGTGTFSQVANVRFFRRLCQTHANSGKLRLYVLHSEGRMIGFILNLIHGDRMDALKSEFDLAYSDFKPGRQLFMRIYQDAFAERIKVLNMGTYSTDFKRRWTTAYEPYSAFVCVRRSLRGNLLNSLFRARERLGRSVAALSET